MKTIQVPEKVLALCAVKASAASDLDPIAAIMAAHRKAGEARGWRCRLCGERSAIATCDKCLEENGW